MNLSPESSVHLCDIRPAGSADAAAVSELAMRSKAHWGYDEVFMNQCRNELTWTAEQIIAPQFDFQVCWLENRPIAFYALERINAEVTELEAIFVDPQFIGCGIGRMLMEHARSNALARGAKRMLIQGDPHAETFYLSAGAILCGSRESDSIPGRQLPLYELALGTQNDGTEPAK